MAHNFLPLQLLSLQEISPRHFSWGSLCCDLERKCSPIIIIIIIIITTTTTTTD
jgi:hypothetical protein